MANKTYQIKIESILGGIAPSEYFAAENQCYDMFSIDPSLGLLLGVPNAYVRPGGVLTPLITTISTGVDALANAPLWMVSNPKDAYVYVYDYAGSVYTNSGNSINGLGDLNDGGTAQGNGCAYYDNYIYFSRSTTVARYGPLNGSPSFTDDYWASTLGLTALTDNAYPVINANYVNVKIPNHILHRHSDGRLYIADIVDNQGAIHYISTSKTTVEGDTNSGSTYNALTFGYGLWPTAIESYGNYIAIGLFEGGSANKFRQTNAKVAFWDTTSTRFNQIVWVEFPDAFISSIMNVNGVLYFVSSNGLHEGFRVSKYVGGNTFQEVYFFGDGYLPAPGATMAIGDSFLFGSYSRLSGIPVIYRKKLRTSNLSDGMFKLGAYTQPLSGAVTALSTYPDLNATALGPLPAFGVTASASATYKIGYNSSGNTTSNVFARFTSRFFRIGKKFKILKISIPLTVALPGAATGYIRVYTDNFSNTYTFTTTLSEHAGKNRIVIRPTDCRGNNDFVFFMQFGTSNFAVALPIEIDYEIIDD